MGSFPIGKDVANLYLSVFPVATSTTIGDQMITLNEFRLGGRLDYRLDRGKVTTVLLHELV